MTNIFKNCTVISAMPAIGKSFYALNHPTIFRDLESSEYHWIIDENGNKQEHPNWPQNYIEAIKNLEKSGMYLAIFVSSHELIREEMAKAGIRYANLCVEKTDEMRQELLTRCVNRKSPAKFINNYNENFYNYIDSMVNDKNAATVVQLNTQGLTQWGSWAAMR